MTFRESPLSRPFAYLADHFLIPSRGTRSMLNLSVLSVPSVDPYAKIPFTNFPNTSVSR
jgi:hypothetical protein